MLSIDTTFDERFLSFFRHSLIHIKVKLYSLDLGSLNEIVIKVALNNVVEVLASGIYIYMYRI